MRATIKNPANNGRNYSPEKEIIESYSVIGLKNGGIKQFVKCRCYMGRSSSANVIYASLWLFGAGFNYSGHGKAGGYGYCKKSAAVADAIESAGIILDEDIAGRGERAIEDALMAIAKAMSGSDLQVVTI